MPRLSNGFTAHIQSLCKTEQLNNVLHALDIGHRQGLVLTESLFFPTLSLCGKSQDVESVRHAHILSIGTGFDSLAALAGNVIHGFTVSQSLLEANLAFCRATEPSIRTWHAIISAYVNLGKSAEALKLYAVMQEHDGLEPNMHMHLLGLKACSQTRALECGKLIHDQIRQGDPNQDIIISNALMHMYLTCGRLKDASDIFDDLRGRDLVSWGTMIGGCARQGHDVLALDLYGRMLSEEIQPNKVVLLGSLGACGSRGALYQGKLIHDKVIWAGLETDLDLNTALIDMYIKCGSLQEAHKMFENLQTKSVVTWCALILGLTQQGNSPLAFRLFEKMQQEGIEPNEFVFSCMLNACGCVGNLKKGQLIHDQVIKLGVDSEEVIINTLVGLYACCGELDMAHNVFMKVPNRSLVSWSIMISRNVENGFMYDALELFSEMQQEGTKPEEVIFSSIFKACAEIGALQQGKLVHHEMMRSKVELDLVVGSTLVDMYAKCGHVEEAYKVFQNLPSQNAVCWGALINGYAQHGNVKMADHCLKDMVNQGIKPNANIYTSILAACNHAGKLEEGQHYFRSMREDYDIFPTVEHVHSITGLLGRVGQLREAAKLLEGFSLPDDLIGWTSLLTSCTVHGNVNIGRHCFDQIMLRDPKVAAAYTLMASIYADAQMWAEFHQVQDLEIRFSGEQTNLMRLPEHMKFMQC